MSPYQRANSSFEDVNKMQKVVADVSVDSGVSSPFGVGPIIQNSNIGSSKQSGEETQEMSMTLKLLKFRKIQEKRQQLIQSKEDFK